MARREVARGGVKVVTARWSGGGREAERAGALGRSQEAERGARGPREERHPRVTSSWRTVAAVDEVPLLFRRRARMGAGAKFDQILG